MTTFAKVARYSIAVVSIGLGLATAVAAPAAAQTYQWTDPAGDMWSETTSDQPAPERTNADVVHERVTYRLHVVMIRSKFTDLRWDDGMTYLEVIGGYIRTNEGRNRMIFAEYSPGDQSVSAEIQNGNSDTVRCGPTAGIDFDANTAWMRIPRPCLGNARWIRVYLESINSTYDAKVDDYVEYGDNAMSTGGFGLYPYASTPRIHRD